MLSPLCLNFVSIWYPLAAPVSSRFLYFYEAKWRCSLHFCINCGLSFGLIVSVHFGTTEVDPEWIYKCKPEVDGCPVYTHDGGEDSSGAALPEVIGFSLRDYIVQMQYQDPELQGILAALRAPGVL